jgi:hypothetical protein
MTDRRVTVEYAEVDATPTTVNRRITAVYVEVDWVLPETPSPSPVATAVSIPTPTIIAQNTAAPATVATVVSIPTPTVTGQAIVDATAIPVPVQLVVSIPAPTVLAQGPDATAQPAVVAVVVAVPAPTVLAAAVATPSVVPIRVFVPTPTIVGLQSTIATPATVAIIVAVPTPTGPTITHIYVPFTHDFPDLRLDLREVHGAGVGPLVWQDVPMKSVQWTKLLGGEPGAINFTMEGKNVVMGALSPGTREAYLYLEGQLVWGGNLLTGEYESRNGLWNFTGMSWAWRWVDRLITVPWYFNVGKSGTLPSWEARDNIDLIDMMWAVIQRDQSGYRLVNRHPDSTANSPAIIRDLVIQEWDETTVARILQDMTARPAGFDWEVTPDKLWRAFHHRQGSTIPSSTLKFQQGANISAVTRLTFDASATATRLWAGGSGSGRDYKQAYYENAADIDQYGLREQIFHVGSWASKTKNRLVSRARREYENYRDVRVQPELEIKLDEVGYGSYDVGDKVWISWNQDGAVLNGYFRINSTSFQMDESGMLGATIAFDEKHIDLVDVSYE